VIVLTASKWLLIVTLLVAAAGCGRSDWGAVPVEYAPVHSASVCSFANRTQDACIARCYENDAMSCNDVGRLLELHATTPRGLDEARTFFDRSCELGNLRACRNAGRVAKRRAAATRPGVLSFELGPPRPSDRGASF
jgi:TPR repeat protein